MQAKLEYLGIAIIGVILGTILAAFVYLKLNEANVPGMTCIHSPSWMQWECD